MDIPLPFGLVSGRLYAGVGDSDDIGRAPDMLGLAGSATFSATIIKEVITGDNPAIIIPQAIVAPVAAGVLMWQSTPDVPLTANLDSAGDSLGWQWKVSWNLHTPDNKPVVLPGWNLDVKVYNPADLETITDITESAPVVPPTAGVQLVKGPKGDPGPTGPPGDGADISITVGTGEPDGTQGTFYIRRSL